MDNNRPEKRNEHKYTFRIIQHNPNLSFPPFQSYLGTGTTLGVSTVSSFVRATATGVDNSSRLIWGSVHHPHDLLSPRPSSISFFDVWNKDTKVSSTYWSHTDRLMTYIFQFTNIYIYIDINITLVKDSSWKSPRSLFLGHCLVEGDFPLVVMLHRMPFLILFCWCFSLRCPVRSESRRSPSVRMKRKWPWKGKSTLGQEFAELFVGKLQPGFPRKGRIIIRGKRGKKTFQEQDDCLLHPRGHGAADRWRLDVLSVRWVRNHVQLGHNHGEKDEKEEYL